MVTVQDRTPAGLACQLSLICLVWQRVCRFAREPASLIEERATCLRCRPTRRLACPQCFLSLSFPGWLPSSPNLHHLRSRLYSMFSTAAHLITSRAFYNMPYPQFLSALKSPVVPHYTSQQYPTVVFCPNTPEERDLQLSDETYLSVTLVCFGSDLSMLGQVRRGRGLRSTSLQIRVISFLA